MYHTTFWDRLIGAEEENHTNECVADFCVDVAVKNTALYMLTCTREIPLRILKRQQQYEEGKKTPQKQQQQQEWHPLTCELLHTLSIRSDKTNWNGDVFLFLITNYVIRLFLLCAVVDILVMNWTRLTRRSVNNNTYLCTK